MKPNYIPILPNFDGTLWISLFRGTGGLIYHIGMILYWWYSSCFLLGYYHQKTRLMV